MTIACTTTKAKNNFNSDILNTYVRTNVSLRTASKKKKYNII